MNPRPWRGRPFEASAPLGLAGGWALLSLIECGNSLPISAPRACSRESHLLQFSVLYILLAGAKSPATELAWGRKAAASCHAPKLHADGGEGSIFRSLGSSALNDPW